MSESVAMFVVGLALLAVGAGLFACGLARFSWQSAIVFGPCVAGLAFNLAAVLHSMPRTTMGNIVGGNIASIGLILGLAAIVRPLTITSKVFATAIPLALVATLLFWFLAGDNTMSRVDASILLVAFVGTLVLLIRAAKQDLPPQPPSLKGRGLSGSPLPSGRGVGGVGLAIAVFLGLLGIAALTYGGVLAATQAKQAAIAMKTNNATLGTTLVAFGTALPSLLAALVAARRGRPDLVLGIVVGSVIFNLLLVAGIVAMVHPIHLEEHEILAEIPAMAIFTLLLIPVVLNGKMRRGESTLLLAAYAAFIVWQATRK